MSIKITLARTSIIFVLSLLALPVFAKTTSHPWDSLQPSREQIIASLNTVELLRRYHYSKLLLDDARSKVIYTGYLKALDPSRSYFIEDDIKEFERWQIHFDDLLKKGDLTPAFTIYKRYLNRASERLNFVLAMLDKGIAAMDFSRDESLHTERKDAPWLKNTAELDDLWRRRLKDEVLRLRIAGKADAAIAEQLTKRYRNQLNRLAQTRGEDIFQTYLNAFTGSYDPHTNYLSPDNAEAFDINMSLSLEGIGAVLQTDNDFVKIVRLVPAGPADKSKQLAPADRIIGVAQGNGEMVDVVGWRLDEVVKLIRGRKGSKVRLEVIPASNAPNDPTSKVVVIIREAVKLEEQAAKKSLLHLSRQGQDYILGIIEIPAFYLDFKALRAGKADYRSTTRDVKRLLDELKRDKVDGIVIDLRGNGGGSLQEATELSGLFIRQGAVVLVNNSNGQIDPLFAESDGKEAYYNGPLTVLVNRLSASASEIFAAAMQDYHRALVVGGQTFGKGTVQSIQPLNHGELKLTLAKFYRVSGQSTQLRGVVPDISYPTLIDTGEIGESSLPQAMPWDSLDLRAKNTSIPNNPFAPYLDELKARHEKRVLQDADFIFTRARIALNQRLMKETEVSLNESIRRAWQTKVEAEQLALENTRRKAKGEELLQSLTEESDDDALPVETEKTNPEKDAWLVESGHILLDWLDLSRSVLASH